jgi:hypothetical protein
MLKLRIERTGTLVSPSASLPNSEVEIWRDGEGAVYAYAEDLGDKYCMHLPGLASFRFSSRGDEIAAAVNNTTSEAQVIDAYRRRVLPMALQVSGREVLHASAVRSSAGVTAFCADSAIGKSTTAFGLKQRGYSLWADDLVAFEANEHEPMAISLPFNLRLRPSAAALFEQQIDPADHEVNIAPGKQTAPLASICILRREGADVSPVAVRQLSSAQAFAAVLAHSWSFALQDPERKKRMINHYLELVSRVPIFEISFKPGLDRLPSLLDAIEQRVFAVTEPTAQPLA